MIDDSISSQPFTLDELLDAGLLDDYDVNIKVRATNETIWRVAREYPFYQSESNTSNNDYVINEDGTVTRKTKNKESNNTSGSISGGYRIDEFGQIIRSGTTSNNGSTLELSTDSLHFTNSSGSRTITVTTNGSWNISLGSASWVHLTQNGASLVVRIDENTGTSDRADYFKIKSGNKERKVYIFQAGRSSNSTSTPSSDNNGCTWIFWIGVGIALLAAILK